MIAELIIDRMHELGWEIKEVAYRVDDVTIESVRRVVRGLAVPSKHLLERLCAVLELDYTQARSCAVAETLRRQYGCQELESAARKIRDWEGSTSAEQTHLEQSQPITSSQIPTALL
jgi:transcriptional regulator with XRE-family HTH domain